MAFRRWAHLPLDTKSATGGTTPTVRVREDGRGTLEGPPRLGRPRTADDQGRWTLVNAASLGISWGRMRDRTTSLMAAMVAALILIATPSGIAAASASTHATGQSVSVIVRAVPGATNAVGRQVKRAGGHVGRELGIINGFGGQVA